MEPQDNKKPKELCRVKKAVKALIMQRPDGMTYPEICNRLQQDSIFLGTYRNLLSLTSSVLGLLVDEGAIPCRGEGTPKVFSYAGHQSLN
jgi:hypothetical protein